MFIYFQKFNLEDVYWLNLEMWKDLVILKVHGLEEESITTLT